MSFWHDIPHFQPHEFDSPDAAGSGKTGMDEAFVRRLQMLRNLYRKPLIISSGFRTAAYNKHIGGAENSLHLKGKAADIMAAGADAYELLGLAYTVGFKGIGVGQKGAWGQRFLHLDLRDEPTIWSY